MNKIINLLIAASLACAIISIISCILIKFKILKPET